ncbi:MAG: hypothetical protein ACI97A_000413 [Planctomycetota bacterium]|jgi:hypothetical protein
MDAPGSSGGVSGNDETQHLLSTASDPNAETVGLTLSQGAVDLDKDFRLGPYRVVIGGGGMGVVDLAADPELKWQVALKVLPPAFGNHSAHLARFKREAELASRLDHSNLCGVLRVGQSEGAIGSRCALLMGQGLDEMLRDEESMSRLSSSIVTKSMAHTDAQLGARLQMIE